ncbi:MAG: DNA-protecting protein DprA [Chloroflexi bacterium]|nr:DNA-protecting protein DprA [Chloroflexota bacterium]
MSDIRYWIGFQLVPGIGPVRLRTLLDHFTDLETAWHASAVSLRASGLNQGAVEKLLYLRSRIDLDSELERLQQLGIGVVTWESPDYPRLLREIDQPPALLYVRGSLLPADEFAVAVVGTRNATGYGKTIAERLAGGLAENGVTVVSGLALGIDGVAHRAALDAGGRTIAVLGSGLDYVYPYRHRALASEIVESGALISDYAPGVKPEAHNFPPRNRIISGLSLGTIVVEADRQSGALITLQFALEQGRETFAVPGNIQARTSAGTNDAIQRGEAKLVTSVEDVLNELNLTMIVEHREVAAQVPENANEALLLENLGAEAIHVDDLARQTGLPASEVTGTLLMMELKGMVRRVDQMSYVLAR